MANTIACQALSLAKDMQHRRYWHRRRLHLSQSLDSWMMVAGTKQMAAIRGCQCFPFLPEEAWNSEPVITWRVGTGWPAGVDVPVAIVTGGHPEARVPNQGRGAGRRTILLIPMLLRILAISQRHTSDVQLPADINNPGAGGCLR
jgi:hypothetical protein